jgi:hypothetical protein
MRPALLLTLLAGCAAAPPRPGFVAIYRWRVNPGCEAAFTAAWHAEAERYRDTWGSAGARLHRADDGSFVATAFWPSRDAWAHAPRPLDLPQAEAVLDRCVAERGEALHLGPVDDVPAR